MMLVSGVLQSNERFSPPDSLSTSALMLASIAKSGWPVFRNAIEYPTPGVSMTAENGR